jgi:hypothetical protein
VSSGNIIQWGALEGERNFFLTRTFLDPWLAHLNQDRIGRLGAQGDDGPALFPVALTRRRVLGRTLSVPRPLGWNSAWYPRSFASVPEPAIDPFVAALEHDDDWDAVEVAGTEDEVAHARRAARALGIDSTVGTVTELPYVGVAGTTWEGYWAARGKGLRKNVRWATNAIPGLHFGEMNESDLAATGFDALLSLHKDRWAAAGLPSKYAAKPRHRLFLQDLVLRALHGGTAWVPALYSNGALVAVAVCFIHDGSLLYYMPTFDVSFARFSPGKVLLGHIIRSAFERGLTEVDLGPGVDAYKESWATGTRKHARLFLHRGGPRTTFELELLPAIRKRAAVTLRRVRR